MTRPCADCADPSVEGCQCSLVDSTTINFSGAGSVASPFTGAVILDPSSVNQATITADGLLVDTRLPACRLYRTTPLTVATGTFTAVEFAHELSDVTGMHSNSVDITRITFAAAGWADIGASVEWSGDVTNDRLTEIRLNGTQVICVTQADPAGFSNAWQSLQTIWPVSAGDYAELWVYQSSGGNLNLNASDFYSPHFYAAYRNNR